MICRRQTKRTNQLVRRVAFTLMEMMVVVAIIVVLAGLGSVALFNSYRDSQVSTAKIKAREISSAVDMYTLDAGAPPANLQALLTIDQNTGKGPYLKNVDAIMDPWGKQFQFDPSGGRGLQHGNTIATPDVFTTTPDGKEVGNWK